ncbi:putative pentatricopeptide repeat-containing protein At1g12700, mitochondrial [Hevea brasiliensis]|uniref:putative pentatricopeptide repeat-containing protein At1g12700, mitochondrial n=1 Tax=Hevea brasiliensis TaxID=3981 RepID=UPI0025DEA9F4|nr:putative pentatricopeptide repeat-containing protein At1g12700, mitochondrial [Hevea brasiliensis]
MRACRGFHLQLQRALRLGIIQSPTLLSFTNSFHSSTFTSTLQDAHFFTSNFKSASSTHLDDALVSFNRFLSALINCFCQLHLVDFGFSILGKILKFGLEPIIVTFTTLTSGLFTEGKINQAVDFFNDLVAKGYRTNVHTYTVLVKGLCKFGKTNVAIGLLKGKVERGCEPNTVTYIAIINALCKDKLVVEALDLFPQIRNKGISPNVITILIDHLCKEGMVSEVQGIFNMMVQRRIKPNVVTCGSLINAYCQHSQIDESRKVFDLMVRRLVIEGPGRTTLAIGDVEMIKEATLLLVAVGWRALVAARNLLPLSTWPVVSVHMK